MTILDHMAHVTTLARPVDETEFARALIALVEVARASVPRGAVELPSRMQRLANNRMPVSTKETIAAAYRAELATHGVIRPGFVKAQAELHGCSRSQIVRLGRQYRTLTVIERA